ncbi:MAG: oligosaccharide flippase family protein [Prevotellaceae bacterium]|jgi:O-antigen/teichoic acid export membrane protein|nr:oligosaccharide flippase family protein [Prevotellaceae bacterium]
MVEGAFFQGIASILINLARFAIIIILIRYYSKEEFGLWAAITSSAAVIATGDFGIVNALRNKMSKLIVSGKEGLEECRLYFFSSFYFFLLLSAVLSITVYWLSTILPFESLFKTDNAYLKEQGVAILLWIQCLFFINIPLALGIPLFFSFQEAKISAILSFIQSMLSFICVIVLVWLKKDIVSISIVYFSTNVFVSLLGTLVFLYKRRWFNIKIQAARFVGIIKELLLVGWKFMGVQLTGSYLKNIGVILSSAVLSVSAAADFSIVQKLYAFGQGIYSSMLNPIWGGYADAHARNDKQWCKHTLSKSINFTAVYFIVLLASIMAFGNIIVKLAGAGNYHISYILYLLFGLLTLSMAFFECSALIQSAINKINVLLIILSVASLIVFPIAKNVALPYGLSGLVLVLTLIWIALTVISYFQSRSIIHKISE